MANIYVRSTDGSNSDNGSTWALAKLDLVGGSAIDANGDTVWVSQAHAATTGSGANAWNFGGTSSSIVRVLCGNDGAEPPTALATTATETFTGAASISIGGHIYMDGLTISVGSTASGVNLFQASTGGNRQTYENCSFRVGGTGTSSIIPGTSTATVTWINCTVRLNSTTTQGMTVLARSTFHWKGGSIVSGSATPTSRAFINMDSGSNVLIEDVDFSNFSSSLIMLNAGGAGTIDASTRCVFRNCKFPPGFTSALLFNALSSSGRIEAYNCDDGATNYQIQIEDYFGTIFHEVSIVRDGGASDGTTPLSWKLTSNTNPSYPLNPLSSPEIVIWNEDTGSSKTVTVEILRDSATNLTDAEVWLEVHYLSSSSAPVATLITDMKADVLASAADQASSSETWNQSMGNPNEQKLSVTFTPQMKGFIIARVMLAKVSTVLYVDPVLTIS